MTPQQIDAMKLALEALELCNGAETVEGVVIYTDKEIAAIKEALAEHAMQEVQRIGQEIEQEPVAWRNAAIRVGEELSSVGPAGYYDMTAQQWLDWAMEQQPHGKNSLAQPEQEPVGMVKDLFTYTAWEKLDVRGSTKVYLDTSPQRKPLTKEEMFEAIRPLYSSEMSARIAVDISEDEYRAIEAAHGIKENT